LSWFSLTRLVAKERRVKGTRSTPSLAWVS
jgi:hypothetical protein